MRGTFRPCRFPSSFVRIVDWLLTRNVVVALALAGAITSVVASVLQSRGSISDERAKQLNVTGYGFMAASMVLFVVIGFRS